MKSSVYCCLLNYITGIIGLFFMGSALACDGVFDPQTGICHRSNGYEIPGQIKGGGGSKLIDYWGAIAIDVVNGKSSGIARDRRSKSSAESDAISACKNLRDCRVVISFKNSCGAVAIM